MIEKLLLNRTHDWSRTGSLQTRLYSLSNSPAVCIILQLIGMMIHCLSRIASLQSVAIVLTALHAAEFLSNLKIKNLYHIVVFSVIKWMVENAQSWRSLSPSYFDHWWSVHFEPASLYNINLVICYFYPNFSIYSSCIHFCPNFTILTFASLAILLEIFLSFWDSKSRSLSNPQHFLRLSSGGTQATFSQRTSSDERATIIVYSKMCK